MSGLLLAGGRLPGSDAPVDVLVRDGVIASVGPAGSADATGVETRALEYLISWPPITSSS